MCSIGPRPHESNFIDHLESYRHPLNANCRLEGHMVGGKCLWAVEIEGRISKQAVMKLLRLLLINIYVPLLVRFFTTKGDWSTHDIPLNNKYRNLFCKRDQALCHLWWIREVFCSPGIFSFPVNTWCKSDILYCICFRIYASLW